MLDTRIIGKGPVKISASGKALAMAGLALAVLAVFSSFFCGPAHAVTASPDPVTVLQPDGTELSIYLKGDESFHWNEDGEGYPVVLVRDTDWWVYAREELGRLVPTEYIAGSADPVSAGIEKLDLSKISSMKSQRPELMQDDAGIQKAPPTGTMKNLVVLVNYSDLTITSTRQEYDDLFNQTGYTADNASGYVTGSVKDYFDEVSYGLLDVQSVVPDPVTIGNGYAYYGANDAWGNDVRPRTMVSDALAALEAAGFDFTTVDGDGDGWVDGLTIIHAGGGEEYSGNNPNYIWSHQWALSSTVTYDGIRMRYYHTEPARRGWDSVPSTWGITRIGVICHETGHFLGLPDLYDYGYDSRGTGDFCLMSGGSWNGSSGTTPSHPSAFCKTTLGWVTPTEITSGGSYILSQVETVQNIYKLQGGFPSDEYFLVENRQGTGFDSSLPGTQRGMMIWHVDEGQSNNDDQTHFMVDVEEASGTQHLELNQNSGEDSDYFRDGNVTEFTGTTTPDNYSYGGSPLGLDISAVGSTGPIMSFVVNGLTITMDDPNGGEVIPVGDVYPIDWTVAGDAPDSVSLYLSIDSGANYDYTIVTGHTGPSAYSWTVPDLPVGTARIRVVAYDNDIIIGFDSSDGDFAIKGNYRYVSPSGGDIYPYSTPDWAANTIQDAIDAADTGDSIMVASATYNAAITVDKGVYLFGGWDSGFTSRDPETNVTTIQGTGSIVSFMSNDPDPSGVDGFTITGGTGKSSLMPANGVYGGGIYIYESSPKISGNIITSNGVANTTGYSAGGGIACYNGSPVIEDNEISDSDAQSGGGIYLYLSSAVIRRNHIVGSAPNATYTGTKVGGGIYALHSTVTMEENVIEDNDGYSSGGGLYAYLSPLSLSGDTISLNDCTLSGGGIYSERSSLTVHGGLVEGNTCMEMGGGISHKFEYLDIQNAIVAMNEAGIIGGGIYADSTWGGMTNNTVDRNKAVFAGGNVFLSVMAGIDVRNNLITYGGQNGFQANNLDNITLQYNNAYGNTPDDYASVTPDTTNMSRHPHFADTTSYDYHLLVHSGGIDTGDPAGPGDPDGSRADLGAFGGPDAAQASPDYVQNLLASALDDTTIQVSWDPFLPGGLGYYAVYGDTVPGFAPDESLFLGSVSPLEETFDHHPVAGCWYYRVSAVNTDGLGGGYSGEAAACAAGPDLTPPEVTVIYPNGGEAFEPADTINIQWTASDENGIDSVSLFYSLNDGGDWSLIAGGEASTGLFEWIAPEVDSDSCRVRIVAYDPALLTGEDGSDGLFSITDLTAPVVAVVYPNGGESFTPGDTIDIQWTAIDGGGVDSVSIYYSSNGGADYQLIAGGEENDLLFRWVAPDINGDSCMVLVRAYDPALQTGEDASDGFFSIISTTGDDDVPAAFYLAQNYPNPFNPVTRIVFSVGNPSRVSLRIYDVAGRLVRVLVDEDRKEGRYEEIWNGTDGRGSRVASGVYFYRLVAGKYTKTRKMVLLR